MIPTRSEIINASVNELILILIINIRKKDLFLFLFFIFEDPFHGLLLTDGRSPFPCLLFIEQTYGSVNINILFKVKFWL